MKKLINFFMDEEGATMVEYALMVALIAVVCIGVVTTLGTNTSGTFGTVGGAMGGAVALLACGAFVRTFDRQRMLATTDFGLASGVALTLFFALSAAVVDGRALFGAWLPALALVAVRVACKIAAVGVLAPLTGITLRKGLLTGLGLLSMSATALMLTQQVTELNPQLGAQTSSVLLACVVVLQVVGALSLVFALRASGEARDQ